jgi:hypothetical protein
VTARDIRQDHRGERWIALADLLEALHRGEPRRANEKIATRVSIRPVVDRRHSQKGRRGA